MWINRELGLPPGIRGRRAARAYRRLRALSRQVPPPATISRRRKIPDQGVPVPKLTVLPPAAVRRGKRRVAKTAQALERLVVTYVPIGAISPNSYNPNRQSDHDFEMLLRSIEDHGFTVPIVVREDTNVIVDGEHRWRAAQVLGMHEIPVVYVSQSDEQAMLATLSHNRARGSEDVELTAQLLRDLQSLGALDRVQDSLLLGDDEIRHLIDNVSAPELLAGETFSPAWEPTINYSGITHDVGQTSVTDQGSAALRDREAALKDARTEQERRQAREDHRVYRVSLVFSGDEADVVQAVLGARAAVTVLRLCRDEITRQQHQS